MSNDHSKTGDPAVGSTRLVGNLLTMAQRVVDDARRRGFKAGDCYPVHHEHIYDLENAIHDLRSVPPNKWKRAAAVACTDLLGDFKPSFCNTSGNIWEATIRLPVVGDVTTTGRGWEEAKLRLWFISEAVKLLAAKQCKDPKDWTESEWRATLKTMCDVMSPNTQAEPRPGEQPKL